MQTLFLAGASGVIGRRLTPLLTARGWHVIGMTRSAGKAALLRGLGAEPCLADVFDVPALHRAIAKVQPRVIIHQLTDLPPGLDPARMEEAAPRNARIRDEGTRILIAAAVAAGVRRFIAQSIAFAYASSTLPHTEGDPLAVDAGGRAGVSARGVASLERQVIEAPLEGLVLRYGRLYGPGTGFDEAAGPGPVHVDAAAHAAALAVCQGEPGIYNIAEDDGAVSSEKAKCELGWQAGWRMPGRLAGSAPNP
jgi:nucleoside-diphosphate-sugar epimerase